MRIEKERMEKKLNNIGCATIIIFFVASFEATIAIACALAGEFPNKMFQINMICFCVFIVIFVLMMDLRADFERKEKWKDVATEKYKYTNIKDFNLTGLTVTCINNGAEETFKIDEIKDPEDNNNFATLYVKRKIIKLERRFLWQTVEDTNETTILYAAKDVIKKKNKLEAAEEKEKERQAEQVAENEYQIIC